MGLGAFFPSLPVFAFCALDVSFCLESFLPRLLSACFLGVFRPPRALSSFLLRPSFTPRRLFLLPSPLPLLLRRPEGPLSLSRASPPFRRLLSGLSPRRLLSRRLLSGLSPRRSLFRLAPALPPPRPALLLPRWSFLGRRGPPGQWLETRRRTCSYARTHRSSLCRQLPCSRNPFLAGFD